MKKIVEKEPAVADQEILGGQAEAVAAFPRPRAHAFDRVELSGAFGDLGTLLPIVVAMILINKLSRSFTSLPAIITACRYRCSR